MSDMTPEQLRKQAEEMLAFDLAAGAGLAPMQVREEAPREFGVLSEKGAKHIVSMVFKSSRDGEPHVVSLRRNYDGTALVRCTCLASEDNPCWGVVDFKRVAGI